MYKGVILDVLCKDKKKGKVTGVLEFPVPTREIGVAPRRPSISSSFPRVYWRCSPLVQGYKVDSPGMSQHTANIHGTTEIDTTYGLGWEYLPM